MMSGPIEDIATETLRASLCGCQDVLRRVCGIDAESADVEALRYLLAASDLFGDFKSLVRYDRAIASRGLLASLSALAIKAEMERRASPNN